MLHERSTNRILRALNKELKGVTAEAIRSSPSAHALRLARDTARILRDGGWQVREAAAHAAGVADAVATRTVNARDVRLVVHCHSGGDAVLFSAIESAGEVWPSFALGDASRELAALFAHYDVTVPLPQPPARPSPPPARVHASLFRDADGSFGAVAHAAFGSIDAILAELGDEQFTTLEDDLDALQDDGPDAMRRYCNEALADARLTVLQPIVVTDAALWLVDDDDFARCNALRLVRTRAATGARAWIDVVHRDAVPAYAAKLTARGRARRAPGS